MEGKGTVLIVDDSAADRALFRTILTRGGYTVHDVSRGTEAVSKAVEIRPHIIVLDVNLPDLNGLEVCRALRGDGRMASVPVLMLTVRHDDADVLKGLEAGADDYVAKDSAAELVLARVQRLVQYRQLVSHAMLNRQLVQVGRLLAGIIHEIRGPLSVIRGSAELLSLNRAPDDPDLPWVDSILRGTHLLQLRLDHLMATVRSGPAQLRPVELGSLVHEAVELFVKGLPPNNRGVRVQPECGTDAPSVLADPGRIIQVLMDLLSNAHQAILSGATEGVIRLGLEAEDVNGCTWIKIEVRDDGPGIPEIYLNRVFEPFFTTRDGGTGYGLYLAAEIVKEQGGRLTASNNSEGGPALPSGYRGKPEPALAPSPNAQPASTKNRLDFPTQSLDPQRHPPGRGLCPKVPSMADPRPLAGPGDRHRRWTAPLLVCLAWMAVIAVGIYKLKPGDGAVVAFLTICPITLTFIVSVLSEALDHPARNG